MKRNKIVVISAVIIGISIIGSTLGGCKKIKALDGTVIISQDVKGEELLKELQIISESKYSLKDTGLSNSELFYDEGNNLNIISEIREGEKRTYIKECIILENGEVFKEYPSDYKKIYDQVYQGYIPYKITSDKIIVYGRADKEIIIDREKFLQSECYKAINLEAGNFQFDSEKVISFIRDEDGNVEKVLWYDIHRDVEGTIKMPDNTRIMYVPKIDDESMFYVTGKKDEIPNAVGIINITDNTLVENIDVGPMYRADILNRDNILVYGEDEDSKVLKLVNTKNKVSREITNLRVYNFSEAIFPKSNDRIIYEQISDGKKSIVVSYITEDNIEEKCVIFQCSEDEYLTIAVSEDGKTIAIGVRDYLESHSYINHITEVKLNK